MKTRWFERIRYEDGAWPLWRLDQNLAYVCKSLAHRTEPWSDLDREHHEAARRQLDGGRWRRRLEHPLRLCLGGDLMWIRDGWDAPFSPALASVIARSDVAIANLETPVDPASSVPKWTYETLHYNAPPAYLRPWTRARTAVLSLCNNHALDQGPDGLVRTHRAVEDAGVFAVGGPRADHAVKFVEAADARVAVTGTTYGINHLRGAPPAGIPVVQFGSDVRSTDWTSVESLVARARQLAPDLVVLVAHWGFEYECWPGERQREAARRLVALGVDVVVGSSPHVLQPVELVSIDGADPDCPLQVTRGGPPRLGLVAWSLGNLATIMPTLRCQTAALVEATFGRTAEGALTVCDLRAFATHAARGNGDTWLAARTLDLQTFRTRCREDADAAHAIAKEALGNTLLEETP